MKKRYLIKKVDSCYAGIFMILLKHLLKTVVGELLQNKLILFLCCSVDRVNLFMNTS